MSDGDDVTALLSDGPERLAVPAGTVMVVRDGPAGIETLMVRRSEKASFMAEAWVFPGGRVDPGDLHPDDTDEISPARRAAVRELHEEAGLVVEEATLATWGRFVPPPSAPKRFSTWFFVAPAVLGGEVVVDGTEISTHRWLRPQEVFAGRDSGELSVMPPTWVALWHLAQHDDVLSVLTHLADAPPLLFHPKFLRHGDDSFSLYEGDAGYHDSDPSRQGPRHRLTMAESGWYYERD